MHTQRAKFTVHPTTRVETASIQGGEEHLTHGALAALAALALGRSGSHCSAGFLGGGRDHRRSFRAKERLNRHRKKCVRGWIGER
jgi:hypothetical protein